MPRANTELHFSKQAQWNSQLLALPAVADVITKLHELGRGEGRIPSKDVATLVGVSHSHLEILIKRNEVDPADRSGSHLTTKSALSLVPKFLPRILGWRSVVMLSEELGIHRNTVESMIRLNGTPEMLYLCRDNRLYVSPDGESFVRRRKEELDRAEPLEKVGEFVTRLGVPLNYVTAFFSARSSPFLLDIHGRARISDEQRQLFLEHRERLEQRRHHSDRVIDGELFRSIATISGEHASLFSQPGTDLHRSITNKVSSIVRHFAEQANLAYKTDIGVYLPAKAAELITDSINRSDASRLLGVPKELITSWRKQNQSLMPPAHPGMRTRGVRLSALVQFARKQFQEDAILSKLEQVPTFLSSFTIHREAKNLHTSYSKVVEMLPLHPSEREILESRVGKLSRATHHTISAILHPEVGQRAYVTISQDILDAMLKNASKLGLSPSEFLDVALSPKLAPRCVPEHMPLKIPAARYNALLQLGLVDTDAFPSIAFSPSTTISEMLTEWCNKNKVHLKTALAILALSSDEQTSLLQGRGEITGKNILKAVSLLRLNGDTARQKYPLQFVNGPRYEERNLRPPSYESWSKNMAAAPLLHTSSELISLLNQKGEETPDLTDGCLSAALIGDLITEVARTRNIEPQRVYAFVQEIFKPLCSWPTTYTDFTRLTKDGSAPLRFAAVVGKFLLDISSPQVVVHLYGLTRTKPTVGNIFVHKTMHDYGTVQRVEQEVGGPVAIVDMVLQKRSFSFRVG